jgi:hypothetical protein
MLYNSASGKRVKKGSEVMLWNNFFKKYQKKITDVDCTKVYGKYLMFELKSGVIVAGYQLIKSKQFPAFAQHFGENGEKLDNNSDEYPAGINSKINNRIEKFRIVRPSFREKPF